ncbi:imidazoleglycerol-phosphate dehydratase HisB [Spirochaeta africana]|uniref:Imidazoleglycerol-phosphate dehydratase n=1 Tax=Spirochaeta africana (strain ATCC 700263 / DSM 8902 / Z-7692) TaxID=889378 RepID=H9UL74_SPIAZ|nr:imidazoleglycerol-phosphate dehydratase HisB [Spirochaeta africana]AFG38267.1 imidazoleglycerol-phosphate dehydratase [Spirochaeta africana DSM 8902]
MNPVTIERTTKETSISLSLAPGSRAVDGQTPQIDITTGLPFMDHMLHACAFHGDWHLSIQARGDIEVDPHHLVEDLGIVLGSAILQLQEQLGPVTRYGSMLLPMDDALCEAVVDLCNRPYLVYNAQWPQPYIGSLDVSLFREFFYAVAMNARCNLHLIMRYGQNSHHIIEAMFKAMGIALSRAAAPLHSGDPLSTKGSL